MKVLNFQENEFSLQFEGAQLNSNQTDVVPNFHPTLFLNFIYSGFSSEHVNQDNNQKSPPTTMIKFEKSKHAITSAWLITNEGLNEATSIPKDWRPRRAREFKEKRSIKQSRSDYPVRNEIKNLVTQEQKLEIIKKSVNKIKLYIEELANKKHDYLDELQIEPSEWNNYWNDIKKNIFQQFGEKTYNTVATRILIENFDDLKSQKKDLMLMYFYLNHIEIKTPLSKKTYKRREEK